MNMLVVGGTSGLGLEIAKKFSDGSNRAIVTGRHDPKWETIRYEEFDLTAADLPQRIGELVLKLPEIDIAVYAAGYYQEGTVTDLTYEQIEEMIDVGGRGLIYMMKSLLDKQGSLKELITITSTSQWTPRKLEPIYNFAKAGAGHFSSSMAEDGRVGKVLVAGPAGMNTDFWEGVERDDLDTMLDPVWVADQIVQLREDDYKYRFAKIMRQPPRVVIEETR
jgi:NAD(P)-dependent dehydrogenase (short-subunit alcohol dehydrogenase family)